MAVNVDGRISRKPFTVSIKKTLKMPTVQEYKTVE